MEVWKWSERTALGRWVKHFSYSLSFGPNWHVAFSFACISILTIPKFMKKQNKISELRNIDRARLTMLNKDSNQSSSRCRSWDERKRHSCKVCRIAVMISISDLQKTKDDISCHHDRGLHFRCLATQSSTKGQHISGTSWHEGAQQSFHNNPLGDGRSSGWRLRHDVIGFIKPFFLSSSTK